MKHCTLSCRLEANAADGENLYSLVILVLPAVRILRGRPGTVPVAAGLETHHLWLSPRLQWRAHTLSYYQHGWSLCLLPGGVKEQWWNIKGCMEKGGKAIALKETDGRERRRGKKQGQKGNGNRKWMGIKSSWGSFLTVCYWQIAYGFKKVQNGNTRELIIAVWCRSTWVRYGQDGWEYC